MSHAPCYKQNVVVRSLLLLAASLTALGQAPVPAAEIPPRVLDAMHCIKSGDRDWLIPPLSDERGLLRFGFKWDRASWPGQRNLFVVIYESRSIGQVFLLADETKNGKTRLTIANNGRFSVEGPRIKYLGEILGGIWTHELFDRTIKEVLAKPWFSVSVSRITQTFPGTCSSYVEQTRDSAR
jgi:hypothetical protein